MKIDKRKLVHLLQSEYQLTVDQLTFVPKGAESYGYIAETDSDTRYFVKIHDFVEAYSASNSEQLVQPYRIADQLKNQLDLPYVVSPLPTKERALLCEFGEFAVALFEFIEGTEIGINAYQEQDREQVAKLVADLHEHTQTLAMSDTLQETFTIPFRQWLLDVIAAAQSDQSNGGEIRRAVRSLLTQHQEAILALLEQAEEAGQQLRTSEYKPVLTHGDLASENIIVAEDGRFFIIDWGKVLWGPAERDLLEFRGDHFEEFVAQYTSHRQTKPNLRADIFDFYLRRNYLAQIADYGSWVLLEDGEATELLHPWKRLQDQLPIGFTGSAE